MSSWNFFGNKNNKGRGRGMTQDGYYNPHNGGGYGMGNRTESAPVQSNETTADPWQNFHAREHLKKSRAERRQSYQCGNRFKTLNDVPMYSVFNKTYFKGKIDEDAYRNDIDLASKVSLWQGDMTCLEIDAVVNAANESLLGGGGIDGAIHRAAGRSLVEECRTLNGCRTGFTKITGGHKLPARYILHTVGPRGENRRKLQECYESCLQIVRERNLKSIAFCCISTGIFGYPNENAAHVALSTVRNWLQKYGDEVDRIIFCVFLKTDFDIYSRLMGSKYFPCQQRIPPTVVVSSSQSENEDSIKKNDGNPKGQQTSGSQSNEQGSSSKNSNKKNKKKNKGNAVKLDRKSLNGDKTKSPSDGSDKELSNTDEDVSKKDNDSVVKNNDGLEEWENVEIKNDTTQKQEDGDENKEAECDDVTKDQGEGLESSNNEMKEENSPQSTGDSDATKAEESKTPNTSEVAKEGTSDDVKDDDLPTTTTNKRKVTDSCDGDVSSSSTNDASDVVEEDDSETPANTDKSPEEASDGGNEDASDTVPEDDSKPGVEHESNSDTNAEQSTD
ncbi:ADP-ribose glycohydrolase MACROD2-like isoform X1 [Clytia hemisphaerica]|uniref:Macro domain-containing protein n=1 Tax=Clytia hemisphaerica TaxID=252671 RepID=A0A7M5X0D8_9CNID